jgi:hypothetical protein
MKSAVVAVIIISLAGLIGCSGSIQGVIRQDAKRVEFAYQESTTGEGSLQTVLPDGERFEGKFVEVSSYIEQTDLSSTGTSGEITRYEAVDEYSGNRDAILRGDRGHMMKCRFKLTDVFMGIASGGYGICQISDGRVVDLFF